jgi:hypothetical protein
MAIDMKEVLGEDAMRPEAAESVIERLKELPLPLQEVKHAFMSWARQTGYQPAGRDLAMLGYKRKRRPR